MKLLVVEDERRIAMSLKKGLEQERFAVDVVYTGTDGYDMASAESYDLILLDVMLPGMDGFTVLKKLRADGNATPILMLTARSATRDKVQGLDTGADDYLTKPFSFEELLARIRAITRRPKTMPETSFTIGDLTLNSETFAVTKKGKSVALSAKEFALLEYFMRNPGKTVTKDTIIAHVWPYDADILPNTVEVYVKKLRAKLESPFKKSSPRIVTIRGFGYKLE